MLWKITAKISKKLQKYSTTKCRRLTTDNIEERETPAIRSGVSLCCVFEYRYSDLYRLFTGSRTCYLLPLLFLLLRALTVLRLQLIAVNSSSMDTQSTSPQKRNLS